MAKGRYTTNEHEDANAHRDDFIAVRGAVRTAWTALPGAQKQAVVNTLTTNWGSATAVQRDNALLAAVMMLFVMVALLLKRTEKL